MSEEMRACALRGMALLDAKRPGWDEQIEPEKLDMSESTSCVLGQLYETFEQGVMEVFGFHWLDDLGFDTIVAHGFVTNIDVTSIDSVELEQVWKTLLAEREEQRIPTEEVEAVGMSEYNEEMRACARRGIALLDAKRPGWQSKIDVASLDLSHGNFCILGQVFGSYQQGLTDLWDITPDFVELPDGVTDAEHRTIMAHGFVTNIDYVELGQVWKALLAERADVQMCPLCPEWDTQYPVSTDFFGSPARVNGVACCEVCYNIHALTHGGPLS